MWVRFALIVSALSIGIIGLLYKYTTRNYNYWKKRRFHGPKPRPFIGNIWEVCKLNLSIGDFLKQLYESSDEPCLGFFIFDEPCLLIKSLDLVKNVLVKDFNFFKDRTIAVPKHDEIFAKALFVEKSPQWKKDRTKLTPLFSSARMKLMFPMVKDIGKHLVGFLKHHPGTHDAKDICNNYSIDVIAKCFFGVDALSFEEKCGHFTNLGKAMFANSVRNGINQTIYFFKTNLVDLLHLRFFDPYVQRFFIDTFLSTVKKREEMKFQPTDFVRTLIDIGKEDPSFGYKKMASQGLQFFTAGFETSASTIAYTIYELALNKDIQEELRNEILRNIEKGDCITYNSLTEMKYLNMCIMETLRKYPPLPFLDRRCDMDYQIPGTDLIIEKGIPIYISVTAIQNDKRYFPNPEEYNPERFRTNIDRNELVHFPFGFGPRTCIGEIFGLLSVKMALIHLILNFEVEKVPRTPIPICFDPKSFTLTSTVGLPVGFREINRTSPLIY